MNKNKFKIIIGMIIFLFLFLRSITILFGKMVTKADIIIKTYELGKLNYIIENVNFETNCDYDDYDDRKNILIVGNSHADDILKFYQRLISQIKYILI